MSPETRWEQWVYRFGIDDTGKPMAMEIPFEEYAILEPAIVTALNTTRDLLRLDSPDGEPLTFMEYAKRKIEREGMTLYFKRGASLSWA